MYENREALHGNQAGAALVCCSSAARGLRTEGRALPAAEARGGRDVCTHAAAGAGYAVAAATGRAGATAAECSGGAAACEARTTEEIPAGQRLAATEVS